MTEINQTQIDAVVTWVDGDDPEHAAKRQIYLNSNVHKDSRDSTRFASRNEIFYCLWSILRFCPFVRRIYIVTDQQRPQAIASLLTLHPEWKGRLAIVDHQTIFGDHKAVLPVFNSRSIETMLHRIPDLSEHFIYFNDDIFVGRPLTSEYFFDGGMPILRGRLVPHPNVVVSAIKRLLGRNRPSRASFKEAQRRAALLLGFSEHFLYCEHHPHPMRRSTMSEYFSTRDHLLRSQIEHRFRNSEQYSPIGLTNHLELIDKPHIQAHGPKGYIKPADSRRVQKRNFATLESLKRGELDTICVQSLDRMTSEDRNDIVSALEAWVAKAEASQANERVQSTRGHSHMSSRRN